MQAGAENEGDFDERNIDQSFYSGFIPQAYSAAAEQIAGTDHEYESERGTPTRNRSKFRRPALLIAGSAALMLALNGG